MKQRYLYIPFVVIATITSGFEAAAQTTTTPPPQFFTLSLPAGVSLISAPLNTGQTTAQGQFLGLPANYPLFFAWDPHSQAWVPGTEAPASLGGGYWVYSATPTTLVVQGQPYSYFTDFTGAISPGWHLFGVPFQEGVGWKDFRLYAGGNPISLDTAMAMGWIGQNVVTVQGNQVQTLSPGQPLQPGVAYWVQTYVPFQLHAERQQPAAANASTTLSTTAPLASGTVTEATACAQQSTSSTSYDYSSAMGWLSAIAEFLSEVTLGIAELPESGWGGASEIASGTFGMIEHGINLGTGSGEDAQLSDMDAQLGTLVTSVCQLQVQLNNIGNQITGLQNWIVSDTLLSSQVRAADSWLWPNFQDPNGTGTSREWARWILAGCATSGSSCPEASGTVTTTSWNNFVQSAIQSASTTPPALATDNFPLWWSYSVVGGAGGITPFSPTAKTLQHNIFTALTATPVTPTTNGLVAYMEEVFGQSGCVNDVTACNLLQNVYYPLEAYFLKAVGDQAWLAEAQSESWLTLSALGKGSTGPTDVATETNSNLDAECEAFLQVAERIALLRAADGTMDWNSFGSSDAGQLLARADFIVMQLAGQNYQNNPAPGYVNPPWPSSGVVGRIFYVDGEPPLSSSGQRGICQETGAAGTFSAGAANCSTPAAYLTENTASARTVTGDWPYLLWSSSGGSATGSPHQNWKVQRLNPLPLASLPTNTATASYVVNSQVPAWLGANMFVGSYDSSYNNLPAPATGSTTFASVNGIEGAIGKYGLPLGQSPWTATAVNSVNEIQLSVSYKDATDAPGGAYVDVDFPLLSNDKTSTAQNAWSASAQFQMSGLPSGWTTYHVQWPAVVNANLNSSVKISATWASAVGGTGYYLNFSMGQQILSNNKTYSNLSAGFNQCPTQTYNCQFSGLQSINAGSVSFTQNSAYTFKASYAAEVSPYSYSLWNGVSTYRQPLQNSVATWVIDGPMFTLTK